MEAAQAVSEVARPQLEVMTTCGFALVEEGLAFCFAYVHREVMTTRGFAPVEEGMALCFEARRLEKAETVATCCASEGFSERRVRQHPLQLVYWY